jgi:anti-sigma B factor antagonist
MEIQTYKAQNIEILKLAGRFDAYEAPAVVAWLDKATAKTPAQVVINLGGVKFVDSTALAALVQGMKHARQREGDVHLCHLQQPVRIIFELTRLNKALNIFGSEEEAVEAFGA